MASTRMNLDMQNYKGIPIRLIDRKYGDRKAKRFTINGTNQNVWIPNKHLLEDGTIRPMADIDYVFRKAQNQLNIAGITGPIIGIKRAYRPKQEPELTFCGGFHTGPDDPDDDYEDGFGISHQCD